ncbi:MAG: hypothetical protein N2445_05115 [Acidobacteria bacterium]|nr:hypothetical protein [Acidobacteriota bacterium]
MLKNKFHCIAFLSLFISLSLYSSIPFVEKGSVIEEPTSETASLLIILEVWNPNISQYKEICQEPKLSLEEFNVIAIISNKSGVPLSQIWKWRKLKLEWETIIKKVGLTLEDVVPKSDKKWSEPYQLCYTYWREKGDPKKAFVLTDYNFEKIGEVITLSKYSEKTIDFIIEEMTKGGSFRELSLKYYKEKTKKIRKK